MPSTPFERFASTAALKTYLVESAVSQYADLFGQTADYYDYLPLIGTDPASSEPVPAPAADAAPVPEAGETTDFSDTNTQVDGVDEADLVETDGQFIYQVNGQLLTVVDARNPNQLTVASQFSLGAFFDTDPLVPPSTADDVWLGIPIVDSWSAIDGMYLQGDRLTVIASGYAPTDYFTTGTDSVQTSVSSWGYGGTPTVQVTVFDVADPSEISVVETSTLEGWLVSSRAIADEVFVVTSNNFQLPSPEILANNVYETEAVYRDRINSSVLNLGLPNVATVDGNGQPITSGLLADASDIYLPLDDEPWQLTTLSTFDVGNDQLGVDAVTSIPTNWVDQVFVSANFLYLLKTDYSASNVFTDILQIDLDTGDWLAQGQVPGYIDDQFSVDESDGFLRIATTTGFGDRTSNNLYILEQQDTTLDIVGKIENLAPSEQIYSTRFQGDYGFVVTFRQVDPLFTFDLSNPRNPQLVGQLKIPGFSEYLQVIEQDGRTLLLGVGQDADPDTGFPGPLKISLFDVTDLANPQEIDSYIFEGDFTSSAALWDHHAITYSASQNLLAIPTEIYDPNTFIAKTALQVFRVDGSDGLTNLGTISHGDAWINRSLYIDEALFAVSETQISAHQLPTLEDLDHVMWSGQGLGMTVFAPTAGLQQSGGERDDILVGNVSQDVLSGGLGVDQMRGGGGSDRLQGDADNDTLLGDRGADRLWGNEGNDLLFGGQGHDRIHGGHGNDQVVGGAGQDYLYGGKGADLISGGGKSDRFVCKKMTDSLVTSYDTITDLAIGIDVIKGKYAIAAEEVQHLGAIDDLTIASLKTLLTTALFKGKGAATFALNDQTFLALNDRNAGFQANRDAIINITGFTGSLEELSIR